MANATKTTTNTATLEARITELEAALKEANKYEMKSTLWLNDLVTTDRTKSDRLVVKFSAQKGVKHTDGSRIYGASWNFVAYGDTAERFQELTAAGERLVTITAFESPWSNGARKSDWVVLSITPYKRPELGDATATAPFSFEPTPF